MKKGFVLGLATGLTVAGASMVVANSQIQALLNNQIKVTLNGQVQEFKDETTNEIQYPITYHDRTYLPLRTVANLVGVGVDYDANSNTAMLSQSTGYTDEQLIELAKLYIKTKSGYLPSIVEKDSSQNGMVTIHLYDLVDNHTTTSDWYIVNSLTGKGTDVLGKEIDISPEGIMKLVNNKSDDNKMSFKDSFKDDLSLR